jgi:hypothetical protein
MALPVRAAPPARAGDIVGPPRWSFPVLGPRLRVSVGLTAVVLGALLIGLGTSRTGEVAWVPLGLVAVVVVSTIVHEGAHAWAAHNLGYRVEWILLGGLTGMTAWSGRDDRPLDRAAVAMAGPAASAFLVLVLLAARLPLDDDTGLARLVEVTIAVNGVALAANLLPVGRTDGRLLLAGLSGHARRRRHPVSAASGSGVGSARR